MIWLIFTGFFALAEQWYDGHLHALKKKLMKEGMSGHAHSVNLLMHSYQMPLRGVFFLLMFFASAGEYYQGAYLDLFLTMGVNLTFFWWFFDILMDKMVLKQSVATVSSKGWEGKYFSWMGGYGYFALKTVAFGSFLTLCIIYGVWQ